MKDYQRLGLIGRFKPLHNGAAVMLDSVCERAERVIIGIGSSNRYNARNPFTAEESREMIDLYLKPRHSNYEFLFVPDFGHIPNYKDGEMWRLFVTKHFGSLDGFVTGDGYVKDLLENDYAIISPKEIEPPEKFKEMRASMVRYKIVKDEDWQSYVPKVVADYMVKSGLDSRLKKEFREEILSRGDKDNWQNWRVETSLEEKLNVQRD